MDTLTAFEVITLAASIVGVYVKLTQEVSKLQSRVIALEKTETDINNYFSIY